MSAGEVERLVSELSGGTGGDEEEEWLYGDENEVERPEEENASANPPSGIEDETPENGVPKPKVTETEDDSDSDSDDDEDDVHVTIGDIKTGAPQYGSYGTAPVNLNIKTGGRVYGTTGTKVKGVDLDAPGSINGVPLLEVDLDSFEDKPWRKPGADLSDYFNYGFNEDTWKAYCEKQKRIRMGLEVIPVTSTTNKITAEDCTMEVTPGAEIQDGRFNLFKVQQGRTGNSEKETALPSTKAEFTSPPSLFKTGLPPSRNSTSSQSQTSTASKKANSSVGKWQDQYGRAESPDLRRLPGAIDVIGQTITISRVEGRRRANENSNIQVLSERSATEVDNNFSKPPPFFPPGAPPTHLPPPPFLPPPPTVSTAPPLIPPPGIPITVPPPGFPPPPGAPPPSLIPTIESGHSSGYDSRSARAFPYGNVMKNDTDTGSMQKEAMSATEQVGRKKNDTEKDDTERKRKPDTSPLEVIVDVAMKVKKETVIGDTSTKNLKEAKKEKKLAASLPLNRRAPKLHLQNRHGYGLLCTVVPEIDTINLIFLDNV
ncbi:pre-mRNA 3'-end-processing factor FIP1 isoform X22 [Lagenorhynchus albirostris]|uniref:pre-mRNA 3'-end-processing factor FIP1 isoform X27 n=1 Tax=Delphinus delphis TaxID=9728 RepID=UPI0028C4FC66|nr:pre-mRNA 3'-end-processing factor FIP1 isoform X27 [Delphinus delphis]XP_060004173.1 pre-mRNA 3'-end-processing factor FIP1 isoform X22 [Lagenorhynchus albirostris]XP_060155330.1 pre-mRNA 3'-end-processing factor FIP1 isoform X28 [Globicephala melas]